MSIVNPDPVSSGLQPDQPLVATNGLSRKFHRVATVRREQGVSLRSAARQMGLTVSAVRVEENESHDLPISALVRWQGVLNVPLADLLVEPGTSLSRPIMERARMVRLMKTALALEEIVKNQSARRMVKMLMEQLTEMMPELAGISAWHSVGQRRSLNEYGRIFERRIGDDWFTRHDD